ncbi:MAG: putative toxin-antitoxin system toxin component, PIN family [Chloroflexota bacterium]
MHRVVFDTVLLVRSLINPHRRAGRLVFYNIFRLRLFVSEPVVREMLEVLRRPELTRKFRSLETLDLRKVIERLGEAEVVEIEPIPGVSRDSKDDKFLATAVAAGANYLVSEDEDLLVLENHQGVQVVNIAAFLAVLGAA